MRTTSRRNAGTHTNLRGCTLNTQPSCAASQNIFSPSCLYARAHTNPRDLRLTRIKLRKSTHTHTQILAIESVRTYARMHTQTLVVIAHVLPKKLPKCFHALFTPEPPKNQPSSSFLAYLALSYLPTLPPYLPTYVPTYLRTYPPDFPHALGASSRHRGRHDGRRHVPVAGAGAAEHPAEHLGGGLHRALDRLRHGLARRPSAFTSGHQRTLFGEQSKCNCTLSRYIYTVGSPSAL